MFRRQQLAEIRRRVFADHRHALGDDAAAVAGTPENAFAEALAGVSDGLHGRIDQVFRDAFPHLGGEVGVVRWAGFFGIHRQPAARATGDVRFFGVDGSLVPVGTLVTRLDDGTEYRVTTGGAISGLGHVTLPVKAMIAGVAGNTPEAADMVVPEPPAGVQPQAFAWGSNGINGGAEVETIESLQERLLARLAEPPSGGGPGDYVRWAREVPGITRAWEFGVLPEPGHVTVLVMRDNDVDPFPDVGALAQVTAHMATRAPVGLPPPTIAAPLELVVDLQITLQVTVGADVGEVRAAVENNLRAMLRRRSAPARNPTTLWRSWLSEAISVAPGEHSHVLVTPAADVAVPALTLVTLGTLTW